MTDHITKLAEMHEEQFLQTDDAGVEMKRHAELTANIALGYLEWCEDLAFEYWKGKTNTQLLTEYLNQLT